MCQLMKSYYAFKMSLQVVFLENRMFVFLLWSMLKRDDRHLGKARLGYAAVCFKIIKQE